MQTGAVALTGGLDVRGAAVVEISPKHLSKHRTSPKEFLCLILYLFECAMEEVSAIRNGVTVSARMYNIKCRIYAIKYPDVCMKVPGCIIAFFTEARYTMCKCE